MDLVGQHMLGDDTRLALKPPGATARAASVVILVPAYNAGGTISSVIERIPASLQDQLLILVVNDGSTDATGEQLRLLKQRYGDRLQVISKKRNEGYARAQKSGFRKAKELGADIVAVLHADGQYPPEELPRLLAPLIKGEADIVLASRMISRRSALKGRMPIYKWAANILLSALENWAYGLAFSEYHSGYMLYTRRALDAVPFEALSDTFHFDGEMLFVGAKKGLRVKELPIPTHYGEEKSHLKPIPYGIDVLRIIWRYKRGKYPV